MKAFQFQIFRVLEPLVDFIFCNLGLKTSKSSLHTNSLKRELFLKAFSPELSTSKLNIKSTSGPKTLKFWI
jgi:hypothetical protein